jgi:hypothetical protein
MSNKDKERHDPQPQHGNGPKDGHGKPDHVPPSDPGRPVPPHRSHTAMLGMKVRLTS